MEPVPRPRPSAPQDLAETAADDRPAQHLQAGRTAAGRLRLPFGRPGASRSVKRRPVKRRPVKPGQRSEEHTSELQSLMRISYAVFCLKKKTGENTKAIQDTTRVNHEKHSPHCVN